MSDRRALRAIPWLGMGVFGAMFWPLNSVTTAIRSTGVPTGEALATPHVYVMALYNLVIGYPIMIWGDFLFRRTMGWVFGIPVRPAAPSSGND